MAKGFNAPKMGQTGMMQQIQRLQEQLQQAQEQLANETITHSAGGGAVKVVVTGDQRFVSIEIDAGLLQDGDVEMLQDLVLTAVNGGLEASRKLQSERLGPLAGGLPF
jgi:hypothetical protein